MESLWKNTAMLPSFPKLEGSRKTDVLIIGGGLAGLLCSHFLKADGVEHILIEKDHICSGTSANTTAKITSQHGLIYHTLLRRFGKEKTQMYLAANEAAISEYRKLCQHIDCNFEEKDSFIYSLSSRTEIEQELTALGQIGHPAQYADTPALPFSTAGAVRFSGQAQFHPPKFAAAIAQNLPIFEQTPALEINGNTVKTDHGSVTAKKIIIATHFPVFNSHGMYFMKLYQQRSYVIAYENAADVQGMYLDASDNGFSLRNHGSFLLIGGNSHRTGKSSSAWEPIEALASRYYPQAQEQYRWAAQDCISLDQMPYIGAYSPNTPDWYAATGFNKWGMTGTMVAAKLLADAMLGRENPYASLFTPSRTMLQPQLFSNLWESTLHLLTPTVPRCSHMGCALKWNPKEQSWDCPCHGSRFSKDGKLLENPAQKEL